MWHDRIRDYYKKGYYTKEQVKVFVPHYISQEECESIVR